jgi:hypothetical protein
MRGEDDGTAKSDARKISSDVFHSRAQRDVLLCSRWDHVLGTTLSACSSVFVSRIDACRFRFHDSQETLVAAGRTKAKKIMEVSWGSLIMGFPMLFVAGLTIIHTPNVRTFWLPHVLAFLLKMIVSL